MLVGLSTGFALMLALRPIGDVDVFWHVLVGRDIVTHHRFTGDPRWVYGPHGHWVTTQWGSEVLFAALQGVFGWAGLIVFNVTCAGLLLLLVWGLLTHVTGRAVVDSPLVTALFAVVSAVVALAVQERPATISLVFLLILTRWTGHVLSGHDWPRWWVVFGLTVAWAQFHGYWVLVSVSVSAAIIVGFCGDRSWARVRAGIPALGASVAAGALTPAGWYAYTAPLRFREAAAPFIAEWQPPTLSDPTLWVLLGTVGIVAFAYRWSPAHVPVTHVLWVLGWALFAGLAARNVLPAVLLILPAAAAAIGRVPTRSHRGSVVSLVATTVLILGGIGVGAVGLASHGIFEGTVPVGLVHKITEEPGHRRVFNHYDAAGYVLALSGSGRTSVVIDSRSDMYGRARIRAHFSTLHMGPGWATRFTDYRPTDVLVKREDPINRSLPALGWVQAGHTDLYVLWERPQSTAR